MVGIVGVSHAHHNVLFNPGLLVRSRAAEARTLHRIIRFFPDHRYESGSRPPIGSLDYRAGPHAVSCGKPSLSIPAAFYWQPRWRKAYGILCIVPAPVPCLISFPGTLRLQEAQREDTRLQSIVGNHAVEACSWKTSST